MTAIFFCDIIILRFFFELFFIVIISEIIIWDLVVLKHPVFYKITVPVVELVLSINIILDV